MLRPTSSNMEMAKQEAMLLDYVGRLERHKKGRIAVHLHLSLLKANNRREHHVRIAANTFESLVKLFQGQLFVLSNSDFVFIYKGDSTEDVENAIFKVRYLFSDDPLVAEEDSLAKFATWYRIERDYDKLVKMAKDLADEAKEQATGRRSAAAAATEATGDPLTPEVLGRVEESLQSADLSNLMRRQTVAAIVGRNPPQPLFSEHYISIKDLRDTLIPDINLSSNRWLFQHLTEVLDRRMLVLLGRGDTPVQEGGVSINLNVATLLSPTFLKFDDSVKAGQRGTLLIELQKIDIFADLGAYFFARDFTHERGYRIIVDGLTHLTLPFVDRERLGADMVKLIWTPEMQDDPDRIDELREQVKRCGNTRTILCRCDTPAAVAFGQSIGISMFQGRHIENLLAEEMRRKAVANVRRR